MPNVQKMPKKSSVDRCGNLRAVRRGIRLPMVSANLTTVKVVECAEVVESEVELNVECAGCSKVEKAWGDNKTEAVKRLRTVVKGWGVIFDREVNDGDYPYCPDCIASIFPNLQARLKAEMNGQPLPPHKPALPESTTKS